MFNKLIYELIKVYVYDYTDSSETCIECNERSSGFFDNLLNAEDYIRKHNHDTNCFFIMRSYILNPTHNGQTEDFLTQRTYDAFSNILCNCPTHHFIVNYNEINAEDDTKFNGRNDCLLNKDDVGWFYDEYEHALIKAIISEPPISVKNAKKFKCLEWYDDSYIVYPVNDISNHQHIISCLLFTDEYVKKIKMT